MKTLKSFFLSSLALFSFSAFSSGLEEFSSKARTLVPGVINRTERTFGVTGYVTIPTTRRRKQKTTQRTELERKLNFFKKILLPRRDKKFQQAFTTDGFSLFQQASLFAPCKERTSIQNKLIEKACRLSPADQQQLKAVASKNILAGRFWVRLLWGLETKYKNEQKP